MSPPDGPPTLHVGLGLDEAYAPHGAVAMASIFDVHPERAVEIHVLHTGLSPETEGALRALRPVSDTHRIHFHSLPESAIGLPGFARFSAAVHLRFHLPARVPPSCRRLLYLDADVVVVDDLSPLWAWDMGDATVAAVEDDTRAFQLDRLRGEALTTYVNSGVLLMDVERWRGRRTTERLVETMSRRGAELMMPDQDAVNLVLRDELALLGRRWNVQRPTFFESRRTLGLEAHEHRALVRDPGIVHFTDFSKPWHATDQHPLGVLYRRLRRRTPFADPAIEEGRSRWTRLATALKRSLLLRVSPEILPGLRRLRPGA
jgi:lipopolysaccharide biosynthesis glycosyltransferase